MKPILIFLVTISLSNAAISQQNPIDNTLQVDMKSSLLNQFSAKSYFILSASRLTPSSGKWNSHSFKDSIPTLINAQLSEEYFNKGRTLQTVGFALLGAGIIAGTIGFVKAEQNYDYFTNDGSEYVILWLLGTAATITSIPLIAVGSHYKRKAKLLLKSESVSHTYHVPIRANVYSVGIAFNLK